MAAQNGRDMLVKIKNSAGEFVTLAGLRSKAFRLNAQAVDILDEDGVATTPVFISIDPDRDTVDVVRDYTENFHDRMIGLTGSPEQVRAASQAYRTYYAKQESEDEYYLVDHTTMSYLVLPEHGFQEFYRRDTTPEQMAESVACFADAAEKAG